MKRTPSETISEAHIEGLSDTSALEALPWSLFSEGNTVIVQAVGIEPEAVEQRVLALLRGLGARVTLYWTQRPIGSDRRPEVF